MQLECRLAYIELELESVSLFIRALDFVFVKPLHRATQFLRFGRARIIHDTNELEVVISLINNK